jgi:hypothetical protein
MGNTPDDAPDETGSRIYSPLPGGVVLFGAMPSQSSVDILSMLSLGFHGVLRIQTRVIRG